MKAYIYLALFAAFVSSHVWAHSHWQHVGRQLLLAEQAAANNKKQQNADTAVAGVEVQKTANELRNRTDREKVTDYAQTDSGRADCFDDDSLRLFNELRGHPLPASGP